MTKRVVVAILVLALVVLAGVAVGCGGGISSDAVAKVGKTLILKADFDKRVQEFATQYSVTPKEEDPEGWAQFEGDVLQYLITYELVSQKAVELTIAVTDADVQTEIDSIITSYYGGDQEKFNTDLTTNNMTLDQLKQNYRESMLMQKVYENVTANITTVPEEDILAYYNANQANYFEDETRTVRHILIAPGGSPTNTTTTAPWGATTTTTSAEVTTTSTTAAPTDADWAKALATANELRTKLEAGGDWTKLAAEYSDDPSTKDTGGDLGDVSKGTMVQEFEDSVFSLKVDEISQPIKTTYGYHVIQVTTINAAKQYPLEEVKDDITNNLLSTEKSDAWQKWVDETKASVGVVYQKGFEPTTTTTAAPTDTTNAPTDTTAGTGDTTATTAAGDTIGTDTTAKP